MLTRKHLFSMATFAVLLVSAALAGAVAGARPASPADTPGPLPNDCQDVTGVGEDPPVCCAFGYVYFDGVPVTGAQVTIQGPGGSLPTTTSTGPASTDAYYRASLSASPLSISPGDTITVTATYSGSTQSTVYQVAARGQQVDVVLPLGSNQPPIATINYIHPNPAVQGVDTISFNGSGADQDEDGSYIVAWEWWSDRDGLLSSQEDFLLAAWGLSPGLHTISFKVRDDEGEWSATVIRTLQINTASEPTPTQTPTPTATPAPSPQPGWRARANMPTARDMLAAAALSGKVYAIAGANATGVLPAVEIYDSVTDSWSGGPALPSPKLIAAAVAVEGKIYVVGGDNLLFSYDSQTGAWTQHVPIPVSLLSEFGMGVVGSKIYITSGNEWMYAYDTQSDQWSAKTPVTVTRNISSLAALNGKLYAIGGNEPGHSPSEITRVDVYDPGTDSWTIGGIPDIPTRRTHLARVSPVINGKIYVIGGWDGYSALNTVEVYDSATNGWTVEASMPTARYSLALAVQADSVYAFGGNWGGSGGNWLSTHEQLVLSPTTSVLGMLLYGGETNDTPVSDTWLLSTAGWSQLTPTDPTPQPRTRVGMIYDSARRRAVVFGGKTGWSMFGDTWAYADGQWANLNPLSAPSPRAEVNMAYDLHRDRIVLFGGYDTPWDCGGATSKTDTWEFDGVTWRQINTAHAPPRFVGGAMAYDEVRRRMVLFTGWQRCEYGWQNETWEYDGSDWTLISAGLLGGIWRYNVQMAYDPSRQRVLLFGGVQHGTGSGLNDTWEYDGAQWTVRSTATTPPGRYCAAMTYDPDRGKIILFGGGSPAGPLDDTWQYDGANWQQVSASVHPSSREYPSLAPIGLASVPPNTPTPTPTPSPTPTPTATQTPTPTVTSCPMLPTPEPLWVDPVTSPTSALTQVVTVYIGYGKAVTVTSEAGAVAVNGSFNAYTNPARVTISLLPNTMHHLQVTGRVEYAPGCFYNLSTTQDRNGNPLVIVQQPAAVPDITVTPTSISVTLPQGQTTAVPLTIRNAGNATLTFAVGEEASAASASASTSTSRPLAFPTRKVDPALSVALDAAPDGRATFFVYLQEQADLSGAAAIADWAGRGESVVRQLQETAARTQASLLAELGGAGDVQSFWIVNALTVTAGRGTVDALAARPDVAYLELAPVVQIPEPIAEAPAIAPQAVEWNVHKIRADDVWRDFGVNGAGVVVANIDTGVDYIHPALIGKYRGTATGSHDFNWYDPTGTYPTAPGDNNGHGTHTMGTMVGDDGGSNQIGVAPGARWIAAKGCGSNLCDTAALLLAAQWILAPCPIGVTPGSPSCDPTKRPQVVNNSWGGYGGSAWYQAAVQAWRDAGIFPAFAAGNSGSNSCDGTVSSPGDNATSFASGATDSADVIAYFSGRGPSSLTPDMKPEVTAPGYNVRSAVPGGGYATKSGTSMASPHTAGAVALILDANPSLSVDQVESLLMSTAHDLGRAGPDCDYGYGRIDAYAAVAQANDPAPWLAAQPTSGSVAAGGEQVVTLTLDAAGLDVRAYTANLVITSNDPDSGRIVVPVSLNVTSAGPQIAKVTVANLRDVSASVSWITTLAADGEVRYGTNPAALSNIAYDDRGASTRDDVHHVTIGGLSPLTTYYFYVYSDGVADLNAGAYYSFTTGVTLGVPGADPVYGQVFKQDGVTPAANVLVYVQALDNNGAGSPGESGLLTALTDASGWWYDIKGGGSLNLASARAKDGSAYFSYSPAGDAVRIEAEGGSDCRRTIQADTGADSPAPPLTLSCLAMMTLDIGRYRSVFVWPLPPAEAFTSEKLLDEIAAQGGNALQLDRWQPELGGWGGHPHNVPFGDFTTASQTPYFLKTAKRSLLQVEAGVGIPPSGESITLTLGWNFIALPWDVQLHAAEACTQIPAQGGACSDIARWGEDDWVIKPCGAPFGDFLMTPGEGYFIKCQTEVAWMPQSGTTLAAQTSPGAPENIVIARSGVCSKAISPDAKDCFGPNDGPRNDKASAPFFTWEASIRDVRIANRRDASLTFTWLTDLPAPGYVRYGADPAALTDVAADDRGANTVVATHHVTLRNLAPETTYYAVLISGQTVDDNGGRLYQVTTGPMLNIPAADPAYGRVLLADGVTPAAGALVYVALYDADGRGDAGEATLLSAVTDDAGYWGVNLGGIRTADNRSYFAYSGTDRLALSVHRAVGQQTAATMPVAGAAPAPTLDLPAVRTLYLPLVTRP